MKRILLLLQLAFATLAFGAGANYNTTTPAGTVTNTVQTISPAILVNPTNNLLTAPGTVQAKITPGGLYSFCLSIHNATLGTTANTLTSCTLTANSQTVNYPGSPVPAIGQMLGVSTTGLNTGAYVTATTSNTFTMSLPATVSGSRTLGISAGSFVATMQSSPDGTTWTTITTAQPKTFQINSALTGTAVSPGLWTYQAGPNDNYLRWNLTSISSTGVQGNLTTFQLRFNIDSMDRPGSMVNCPYVNYNAASANTFPTQMALLPPIDTGLLCEGSLDVGTSTGFSLYLYQSADDTGVNSQYSNMYNSYSATPTNTNLLSGAGRWIVSKQDRYFYGTSAATAISACVIQGYVWKVGNTTTNQPPVSTNAASINGFAYGYGTPQASGYYGNTVLIGTGITSTDFSSATIAGYRVNGSQVSSNAAVGSSLTADINFTITTLSPAAAIIPILSVSADTGVTWSDTWMGMPITSSTHQQMAAIPVEGLHRWTFLNVGGNATTATAIIIVKELAGIYPVNHQFVDIYAASNPTKTVINGVDYISTLISTNVNSISSVAIIDKCKTITLSGVFTGGTPVTNPVYTLQVSNDLINWKNTSCTITPTAAGYFTADITSGCYRYARVTVTTASVSGTPYGVSYIAINGIQ